MKSFEEYVKSGAGHDVMKALELLTRAYVSQCGISLGCRTVVYCAAEAGIHGSSSVGDGT